MSTFDDQLSQLQARHPGAHPVQLPDGTRLVVVPDYALPAGWNRASTTIRFILQSNYPFSQPDCFWADGDLRLANGGLPRNAQVMGLPGVAGPPLLWFSWHLAQPWNPSRDTLATWIAVIAGRFGAAS